MSGLIFPRFNFITRRVYLILLSLAGLSAIHAQRLTTGLTYDIYGFHPTKFPSEIVFSETNYKAYYVKEFQVPHKMSINMSLNVGVDYGRFFLTTKFGLSGTPLGIIYKLSYPVGENDFKDYYTKIQYAQTDISASLGYFLNAQKFMKPYIEAGFGRSSPYMYNEDFSTDKSFKTLWSGRHEIKNLMELDKSFNYLLIGIGYRGDVMAFSGRYKIRIGNHNVFYSAFTLGITANVNYGMLRKYYIYQPDE